MTDAVVIALINSIITLIGTMFTGILAYYTLKLNIKTENISIKTDVLTKVSNDTHMLVNSAMGAQLRLASVLSDRIAALTKDPDDEKAADEAHRLYDEHMLKQKKVDEKKDYS